MTSPLSSKPLSALAPQENLPEGTFLMNLSTLLSQHLPAYHEDWQEWFTFCKKELASSPRMKALEEELAASPTGHFQEPVILYDGEWAVDEETGERVLDPRCVTNGMHRLAVHKFLEKEEVLVRYGFPPTSEDFLNLDLTLYLPSTGDEAEDEKLFDHLLECLSFRHHGSQGNTWLEWCGCIGGITGELEVGLLAPGEDIYRVVPSEVLTQLEQELAPLGVTVTSYQWHYFPATDEEEDIYFL